MTARLPLEHVRATVLTQAWAGAFATRLLADMGAEVIQVEALSRIDPWRGGYPPRLSGTYPNGVAGDRPYDRNAAYNSVNTGKMAITLDLNDPDAKEILLDLVSISDVFAENFSARVLPNMGLEYPVLRAVNPSIVLLRMPAYGSYGPYSTFMGNGGTIEPMSGISSLLGYEDGPPMNSGVMHSDPFAGLMGMASVLIALHHRARTGVGQEIDLSQQETTIGLIADRVIDFGMNDRPSERLGNRSERMAPHDNYRCRGDDEWVAIAVRTDIEWERLCKVIQKPMLALTPRFRDLESRLANLSELNAVISSWTAHMEKLEAARLLQSESIPAAPVYKADELLDNPQLVSNGFFQTVKHPETGAYPHAGVGWGLSKTPALPMRPAPMLGQHSKQVLTEHLGMPANAVQRLWDKRTTGDTP